MHRERLTTFVERDLEIAIAVVQRNGSAVTPQLHYFDAGRSASCQKRQHTLPFVRRSKAKTEQVLILRKRRLLVRETANLGWRSMIHLADRVVDPAPSSAPHILVHVAHLQTGFVDEFFGKV